MKLTQDQIAAIVKIEQGRQLDGIAPDLLSMKSMEETVKAARAAEQAIRQAAAPAAPAAAIPEERRGNVADLVHTGATRADRVFMQPK